jgi:small subunit ribosomal protein S17e
MFINALQNKTVAMGRIKTTFIKRKTKELLKMHGDKFTTEFKQNKKITDQHTILVSKKLRNVIAGYMTRLKRKE